MKINSITTQYKANNAYRKTTSNPQASSSISFGAKCISLEGRLEDINNNKFPDNLYLNLDEVYKTFENQRFYHRWEKFPEILGELLAKRTDYLGLTQDAEYSGTGSKPSFSYGYRRKEYISIHEPFEKTLNRRDIDFEWTRQYHELEDFFEKNALSMENIKAGLPAILKKQGWIK